MNKEELEEHRRRLIELSKELKEENLELKIKLNAIRTFILDNFTNDDGSIWHEDMRLIYEIIEGK